MTLVRLALQIGFRAARAARAVRIGRTIALPALVALAAAGGAHAAVFTVTSALDPGNGVCDATCTLREAIAAANANGSAVTDTINFSIAGTGPFAILVTGSALPTITTPVAISAAGEAISGAPGIQVDGSALASGNGLTFGATADGSSVSYLSISNFPGNGIDISSDSTIVADCYVGLATDGTTSVGNDGDGIRVGGASATIGGTGSTGNVVSANGSAGIQVDSAGGFSILRGNRIGTNALGTAARANASAGISSDSAAGVTVGGNDPGQGNLISGNSGAGVYLSSGTSFWALQGNLIGLNAAGTGAIPNGTYGIDTLGDNHLIGSTDTDGRNIISGNTTYGILVYVGSNAVDIHGNYIGTNQAGTATLGTQTGGIRVTGVVTNCIIGGTSSTYRNVISGNSSFGVALEADTSGCVVEGNYIGLNAAGDAAVGNDTGVHLGGSNNLLGGDSAGERNVISGNGSYGVLLHDTNQIRGNYIGTNPAGTAAIANGSYGIRAIGATSGTVGGTGAGEGNLISGNGRDGITLDGDTVGLTITGNRIGTNAAGTAPLANLDSGIGIGGTGHIVGGATAAARNLISGNSDYGVLLGGTSNVVRGNYIGTDVTGASALGNGSYGIRIYGAIDGQVGGPNAADGNVIGGNGRGVSLEQGATGNVLRNNIIGLNATATANLADQGTGIQIFTAGNTIGAPGDGNVIAAMSNEGIQLSGAGATGNLIQGNWIGTNPALAAGFGNGGAGIWVIGGFDNKIGGTGAGEGNVVTGSGYYGVKVERGDGNEISGNSIFGNSQLGIDVGVQGVFPNDGGDGDLEGNRGQNYPLISSAIVDGGSTDVEGLLINEPNTEYRVEFFSSPACDETGFGEGRTYRGSTLVTTGGGGQAILAATLPLAIADPILSATVTDPAGNTSEFSPCVAIGGPNAGKFQLYRNATFGYEGMLPTAPATVTRSHGLSGSASVTLTSADVSAVAGSDYTDADQVLTFAPWEVVKIVEIPILLNLDPDAPVEHADLNLSLPTAGATLGATTYSDLYIFDTDPGSPAITVEDAFVDEGDSGQKSMTFTVRLSPTGHDVTLQYWEEPGTALEGVDYEPVQDTFFFPVSAVEQTATINVPVYGDTDVEAHEQFWVRVSYTQGGGYVIGNDTYGYGEIRNDDDNGVDPLLSDTIFADGLELGSTALWSSTAPAP